MWFLHNFLLVLFLCVCWTLFFFLGERYLISTGVKSCGKLVENSQMKSYRMDMVFLQVSNAHAQYQRESCGIHVFGPSGIYCAR